jgi:hypothetical protein
MLIDSLGMDNLGGHLKTGHTWTPENRPMDLIQDKSSYTVQVTV